MFAGVRSALRPTYAAASCRAISSTTARPALVRSALVRHERAALCSRRPFHAGAPTRLARQRGSPPGGAAPATVVVPGTTQQRDEQAWILQRQQQLQEKARLQQQQQQQALAAPVIAGPRGVYAL